MQLFKVLHKPKLFLETRYTQNYGGLWGSTCEIITDIEMCFSIMWPIGSIIFLSLKGSTFKEKLMEKLYFENISAITHNCNENNEAFIIKTKN